MLSAATTAVLLALCAGTVLAIQFVSQLSSNTQANAQATTAALAPEASGPTAEDAVQEIVDQYQKREMQFRASIKEANAAIINANTENKRLAGQLTETQQALATAAAGQQASQSQLAQAYPVTSEMAANLALSLAQGSALNGDPELVTYQEHVAYKVTLDVGYVIVDANTNAVLYAGRNNPEG